MGHLDDHKKIIMDLIRMDEDMANWEMDSAKFISLRRVRRDYKIAINACKKKSNEALEEMKKIVNKKEKGNNKELNEALDKEDAEEI